MINRLDNSKLLNTKSTKKMEDNIITYPDIKISAMHAELEVIKRKTMY